MAVDIKTLRIGSHVEFKGKRGCIFYISPGGDFMNCGIHTTNDCGLPADYHVSGFEQIRPIPITPALLEELEFVNTSCTRRIVYTKGSEYEDSWIEFRNLKDRWEIFVSKDNWDGRTVCRYLHEAEVFLALHGVELINE